MSGIIKKIVKIILRNGADGAVDDWSDPTDGSPDPWWQPSPLTVQKTHAPPSEGPKPSVGRPPLAIGSPRNQSSLAHLSERIRDQEECKADEPPHPDDAWFEIANLPGDVVSSERDSVSPNDFDQVSATSASLTKPNSDNSIRENGLQVSFQPAPSSRLAEEDHVLPHLDMAELEAGTVSELAGAAAVVGDPATLPSNVEGFEGLPLIAEDVAEEPEPPQVSDLNVLEDVIWKDDAFNSEESADAAPKLISGPSLADETPDLPCAVFDATTLDPATGSAGTAPPAAEDPPASSAGTQKSSPRPLIAEIDPGAAVERTLPAVMKAKNGRAFRKHRLRHEPHLPLKLSPANKADDSSEGRPSGRAALTEAHLVDVPVAKHAPSTPLFEGEDDDLEALVTNESLEAQEPTELLQAPLDQRSETIETSDEWLFELELPQAQGLSDSLDPLDTSLDWIDYEDEEVTLADATTPTEADRNDAWRAGSRAAALINELAITTPSERRRTLRWLERLLTEFPHGASHAAIARLITRGSSVESLRTAAGILRYWRSDDSLWLVRTFSHHEGRWKVWTDIK